MKILSTPTARTRNGTTSMMIRVAGTPAYENVPNELATEHRTIRTPHKPTMSFVST